MGGSSAASEDGLREPIRTIVPLTKRLYMLGLEAWNPIV
jgi:hypothetical protein